MRPDIRELIQSGKTCVLATVSEGQPHCSLMSYAADENGREIYMATLRNTKKYKNLVVNPSVSLLIDSREGGSAGRPGTTRALRSAPAEASGAASRTGGFSGRSRGGNHCDQGQGTAAFGRRDGRVF